MSKMKNLVYRYMLFVIGLFIASLGVAFSTIAGLGTSPVSSVPYSVSLVSNQLSFGGWLNLWSLLQISIQVILLGKNCKPVEIVIQTVLAFLYGYMTNFSCFLISGIRVTNYMQQMFYMILSCFIVAFGIWIQLKGNVAMLPGEAMNRAIATVSHKKYENIKIILDVVYIVVSVIISLAFTGKIEGVREGSVIAAISIGLIIKWYLHLESKNKYDKREFADV